MPQLQLRRAETILQNMISLVVAPTDLSDLSDTSGFKHVLAACARELDESYYQLANLNNLFDLRKARGEDLDERAQEIAPGTMKRLQARRAVGAVVFSRNTTSGTITIPNGTIIKTADGTLFRTTLQASILNTQSDSDSTPIAAITAGALGNVPAGTIKKFSAKVPGVDSVTNGASTSYGRDQEEDDLFLQRLLNYLSSLARCSPQALEFAAVGLEDDTGKQVIFAHIFEDPVDLGKVTLFIDDGAGTVLELDTAIPSETVISPALGGEDFLYLDNPPVDIDSSTFTITSSTRGALTAGSTVFINPASGLLKFTPALSAGEVITAAYTPFAGLIPVVQKVVDGDPDDRANFPGYRAAGALVRVLSPDVVTISVEAVLTLTTGTDRPTAVVAAELVVLDYINNLGISKDIIRNELIERLMGVDGVEDLELVSPSVNIVILDDQIPRTSSATIDID